MTDVSAFPIYRLAQLQAIFEGTNDDWNRIFQSAFGRRIRIMYFNAGAATDIIRTGVFQTSSTTNVTFYQDQLTYAFGIGNLANVVAPTITGTCNLQFDSILPSVLVVGDLAVVAGALNVGTLGGMVDNSLTTFGGFRTNVGGTSVTRVRITQNFNVGDVLMLCYMLDYGNAGAGATANLRVVDVLTNAIIWQQDTANTSPDPNFASVVLPTTTAIDLWLRIDLPAPNGNFALVRVYEVDYVPVSTQSDII